MEDKKILITGGSGLLGKHLQEIMPASENTIYISSKDYNLTSEVQVKKMYNDHKPGFVCHFAAKVAGILENQNKQYDFLTDNVLINSLVINGAIQNGIENLIAISSSCAYPDYASSYPMTELQVHESKPTKTNFSYSYAKRLMQVSIDSANTQFGLNYQYLIPCNLYGEYDGFDVRFNHFVSALIKKIHLAKKNGDDKIILFGDGKPLRQFMYAKDLALVIKKCIDENVQESFNVACSENLSILEMAKIALKSCDAEHLKIEFDENLPSGQFRKDIANSKMMSLMPEFEFTSLEDGIRQTYKKAIELNKL